MDTSQFRVLAYKLTVFTLMLQGVSGQLRMTPENVAAVVGTKVVLQCQGSNDNPDLGISWIEYISGSTRRTISANEKILNGTPNYALYSISGDSAVAKYHLNIDLAFISGGRYQCYDGLGPFEAFAHITVLQSDPVCNDTIQKDGAVEEGETITYTCEVAYNSTSIDWPPVMTWTGPDGTIFDVTKLSTSGGTVTSSVDVTGAPGLNGAVYSVRTHFEDYGGSQDANHATNVPIYSHSQSFRAIKILENPRNIYLSSDENCQILDSAIECRADGNPPPMYRWRNLVDNSIQYGPMLNITQNMLGSEHAFSCEAYNIIRGTERHMSKSITFTVFETPCSTGGLSFGAKVSIGVAVGIVGVCGIAGLVCFIVKKKK